LVVFIGSAQVNKNDDDEKEDKKTKRESNLRQDRHIIWPR